MNGRGNFVGWLEMRTMRVCWLINSQGMELLIMGGLGPFVGWVFRSPGLEQRTMRVCWLIKSQGLELLVMGG